MPHLAAPAAFVSLALAPLVVGLAGCPTAVAQTVTVDKETVAAAVSDQLAKRVGRPPDSVTCPEDLKGVVGTQLRCELVAGNDTYGVTVTVTSVKGTTVNFDIAVDDKPQQPQ
ncbi:MAG TPA: DUF4333 domain-containing protein [Mycobacterium sp.]